MHRARLSIDGRSAPDVASADVASEVAVQQKGAAGELPSVRDSQASDSKVVPTPSDAAPDSRQSHARGGDDRVRAETESNGQQVPDEPPSSTTVASGSVEGRDGTSAEDSGESPVDALFAKIRASRASDVADAHRVLDAPLTGADSPPDRRRPSPALRAAVLSTAVLVDDDELARTKARARLSLTSRQAPRVELYPLRLVNRRWYVARSSSLPPCRSCRGR